jgi:leader peptidase (prepilin peptidase)/N-methyltransferase
VDETLAVLTHTPGLVLAIVLGLLWGSFANVCVYRWPPSDEFPNGRSVVAPGSHCSACKAPVRWYDNVPILSYLWLRGRCRDCKTEFSSRYLVVEAVTAMLFATAWWFTFGTGGMLWPLNVRALWFVVDAGFLFTMVVITFIDIDHKLILNKVTVPAMILGYAATFVLPGYRWYDGLIGAAVGYGVPWVIGELYFRIRKIEGLGLGDSTLLAVVGSLLGWHGVVFSLFGGSVIGSVIGIAVLLSKQEDEPDDKDDEPAPPLLRPLLEKAAIVVVDVVLIAAVCIVLGVDRAVLAVFGGVLISALVVIVTILVARRSEPESPESEAPSTPEPGLLRTELPFGPFLATAAVVYLFAAPWIDLHFRL